MDGNLSLSSEEGDQLSLNGSEEDLDFENRMNEIWLLNREEIMVDKLEEYKRVGFKWVLFRLIVRIAIWIAILGFAKVTICCWSASLQKTEHIEMANALLGRQHQFNLSSAEVDCPLVGSIKKFWSPDKSTVDMLKLLILLRSILQLVLLFRLLHRSIYMKRITVEEARNNWRKTEQILDIINGNASDMEDEVELSTTILIYQGFLFGWSIASRSLFSK